jgi:phage replication O-like protein O
MLTLVLLVPSTVFVSPIYTHFLEKAKRPMSKKREEGVQLANGFTTTANELICELSNRAGLKVLEKDIISVVLRFTYGWYKQKRARIPQFILRRYTGIPSKRLKGALDSLVRKNILVREPDDYMYINKNHETWVGVPRRPEAEDQRAIELLFRRLNPGPFPDAGEDSKDITEPGTNGTKSLVPTVPSQEGQTPGTNGTKSLVPTVPSQEGQTPGTNSTKHWVPTVPRAWYQRYQEPGTNGTKSLVPTVPSTGYQQYQETPSNTLKDKSLQASKKGNKSKLPTRKKSNEVVIKPPPPPVDTMSEAEKRRNERVDMLEVDREFAMHYLAKTGTAIDLVMAESVRMDVWKDLFKTYSLVTLSRSMPGFFATTDKYFSGESGKVTTPWLPYLYRTWLAQGKNVAKALQKNPLGPPRDLQSMNRQLSAALEDDGFTMEQARQRYYDTRHPCIVLHGGGGFYRPDIDTGWDAYVQERENIQQEMLTHE